MEFNKSCVKCFFWFDFFVYLVGKEVIVKYVSSTFLSTVHRFTNSPPTAYPLKPSIETFAVQTLSPPLHPIGPQTLISILGFYSASRLHLFRTLALHALFPLISQPLYPSLPRLISPSLLKTFSPLIFQNHTLSPPKP